MNFAELRGISGGFPTRLEADPRRPFHGLLEISYLAAACLLQRFIDMMKLQLRLALECAACGEIRDEEAIEGRIILFQMFGAVEKGVCPICYRELPEEEREEVYRKWEQIQRERDDD